jgi:ribosome biogenesis GTPase A
MSLNNGYFCIVLGETGVWKSSFINAITRKNSCKIGNNAKAYTLNFKIESTSHNKDNYFFIDTPGEVNELKFFI